jgi:hypothetical protein
MISPPFSWIGIVRPGDIYVKFAEIMPYDCPFSDYTFLISINPFYQFHTSLSLRSQAGGDDASHLAVCDPNLHRNLILF